MTVLKTAAVALVFVGAIAFGVWVSPYVTERASLTGTSSPAAQTALAAAPTQSPAADVAPSARPAVIRTSYVVPARRLDTRLQPLMQPGTDMRLASKGFRDAEQFAAVAHAARNDDIPFVVLKAAVLKRGMPLAQAIHRWNPRVNSRIEADRAIAEARSDVAAYGIGTD